MGPAQLPRPTRLDPPDAMMAFLHTPRMAGPGPSDSSIRHRSQPCSGQEHQSHQVLQTNDSSAPLLASDSYGQERMSAGIIFRPGKLYFRLPSITGPSCPGGLAWVEAVPSVKSRTPLQVRSSSGPLSQILQSQGL